METMTIRPAAATDVTAISALIGSLMPYLTLHPDGRGAEKFIASMAPAALARYVTEPNYHYLAGCIDGQLVGVAALRDGSHVFHLFVTPAWHRRGLASQLWLALLEAAQAGPAPALTVNASRMAIGFYQRRGFSATEPVIENLEHGIAYQPMRLLLPRAQAGAPKGGPIGLSSGLPK